MTHASCGPQRPCPRDNSLSLPAVHCRVTAGLFKGVLAVTTLLTVTRRAPAATAASSVVNQHTYTGVVPHVENELRRQQVLDQHMITAVRQQRTCYRQRATQGLQTNDSEQEVETALSSEQFIDKTAHTHTERP